MSEPPTTPITPSTSKRRGSCDAWLPSDQNWPETLERRRRSFASGTRSPAASPTAVAGKPRSSTVRGGELRSLTLRRRSWGEVVAALMLRLPTSAVRESGALNRVSRQRRGPCSPPLAMVGRFGCGTGAGVNIQDQTLFAACRTAGLSLEGAELIRAGENMLYRLPGRVVARVTRPGQVAAATKEVLVSRWLTSLGVPVVEALDDVDQPLVVHGRAVTFWRELPPHRNSTIPELAEVLWRLHALPAPDFELPGLAPFVCLRERISEAAVLGQRDRDWLLAHLSNLQARGTAAGKTLVRYPR
jgi:hypothetical protein